MIQLAHILLQTGRRLEPNKSELVLEQVDDGSGVASVSSFQCPMSSIDCIMDQTHGADTMIVIIIIIIMRDDHLSFSTHDPRWS